MYNKLIEVARHDASASRVIDQSAIRLSGRIARVAQAREWLAMASSPETLNSAYPYLGVDYCSQLSVAVCALAPSLSRALDATDKLPIAVVDTASFAPSGTTLWELVGDPARTIATWKSLPLGSSTSDTRDALLAYPRELSVLGYASPEMLDAGLPGTALFAIVDALLQLADTALPSDTRDAVTKKTRNLLSSLLDIADMLVLAERDTLMQIVEMYDDNGRGYRARRLLGAYLEMVPDDACAAAFFARLLCARDAGHRSRGSTLDALKKASALNPNDAGLALELIRVHRERGDYDTAKTLLERTFRIVEQPEFADVRIRRADIELSARRTDTLIRWNSDAEKGTTMPTVVLDDTERSSGRMHQDTLTLAANLYSKFGTLAIVGAFDSELLTRCREHFLSEHEATLDGSALDDALSIGNRRFQVTLSIDGPFNTPEFYANSRLIPLLRRLLDRQAIIGSVVCATSLPGAKAQHWHKDHRAPFTRDADDTPIPIPPVAVTLMIPLVPLDEDVGTTEVRKGSHRLSAPDSLQMAIQKPLLPLGSCFLMDLALSHAGQANRTDLIRPIVNMQYTRRWFVDNKNFHKQPPLVIPAEEWQKIPDKHRSLFHWACQPGPKVNY